MKSYKAAFYEHSGHAEDVLQIGFFDKPKVEKGEVCVRIEYSGINPSDTKMRAGLRGDLLFPKMIPHSDGSGVIEEIGHDVSLKLGERVWMYNAGFQRAFGTAGEFCTLPETLCVPLQDHMSFQEGACLGIPALTAAACLLSLDVKEKDTIIITGGAGSVGLASIQLAKFLNLKTIVIVSSPEKAIVSQNAGADIILNYKKEPILDRILDLTQNKGASGMIDVDFGGNIDWSIQALRDHAVISTYASASNPTPSFPFYMSMFKTITLKPIFVYTLTHDMRHKSIHLLNKAMGTKAFKPIIHSIYPLEQIAQAHKFVETGHKIGQILLKISGKNF
jgi:NADPH2:quinone reductase